MIAPDVTRRTFLAGAAALTLSTAAPRFAAAAAPPRKYRVVVIGHTGRGDYGHGLDVVWRDVPGTEIVASLKLTSRVSERKSEKSVVSPWLVPQGGTCSTSNATA